MNRVRLLSPVVGLVIAIAFTIGCQNTITDSGVSPPEVQSVQWVPTTQKAMIGLSKSVSRTLVAHVGGTLGGAQTDGNYVEIPGNALPENIHFTFDVYVDDKGALVFDIAGEGYENEHIYLENDLQATIAVNKEWLAEEPEVVFNYDNFDEYFYNVTENASHYLIPVDHFSRWSWGILE